MDAVDFIRYAGGLVVTLGLMLGAFVALKRFGPRLGLAAQAQNDGPRRIDILETRMLDARRRLVVVRFAGAEHLVLLGPTSEQVIARGDAKAST